MKNIPILYNNKSECCGCTACYAVCPIGAITMVEDEEGFEYPQIDEDKCIRCGMCQKVCAFKS
jgi:ferredoxin